MGKNLKRYFLEKSTCDLQAHKNIFHSVNYLGNAN